MYIYIYVYVYIYTHTYIYIYVYIYIDMYIYRGRYRLSTIMSKQGDQGFMWKIGMVGWSLLGAEVVYHGFKS